MTVLRFFRRKRADTPAPELELVPGTLSPSADPATGEPEDSSPLAERLATMQWPTPSEDVRERCLREILDRVGADLPETTASSHEESEDGPHRAAG